MTEPLCIEPRAVDLPGIADEPRERSPRGSARSFVLAAFALGQAIGMNRGYLHPVALAWLAIALGLIISGLAGRRLRTFDRVPDAILLMVLAGIQWAQLLAWGLSELPRGSRFLELYVVALTITAAGAVVLLVRPGWYVVALGLLLAGHVLGGQQVIHASPHLRIDVWHFQQLASEAILRGQNPYHVRLRNPYSPRQEYYGSGMVEGGWLTVSYPYPPLTLVATTPTRLLLGDIRFAHLIAIAVAVGLMVLAAPGPSSVWAGTVLLLTPGSMLIVQGGWTEPLVALGLAGSLYCVARAPKMLWLWLGMLLASKQYALIMAPAFVLLRRRPAQWTASLRLLCGSLLVAGSLTIPVACWDVGAFWRSVVLMQFQQPFRADALTFNAMLAELTGVRLGAGLGLLVAFAAGMFALRRAPRTPTGIAASSALVLLCFFAFNKQAFCNYYYLVTCACCFAGALDTSRTRAIAGELQLTRTLPQV